MQRTAFPSLKIEDLTTMQRGHEALPPTRRAGGEVPMCRWCFWVRRAPERHCSRTQFTIPHARAETRFLSFNASAMSDTLLESQLFGHERGAFTGAQQMVKGKFELAHGGTFFLDEISEMSPLAQVKILRVLEYGEFERLGSEQMLRSDVRIICAANCSLREQVRRGKFREDLYHRFNGLTFLIPPLRERLEELPALIAAELRAAAVEEDKNIEAIHPDAMESC